MNGAIKQGPKAKKIYFLNLRDNDKQQKSTRIDKLTSQKNTLGHLTLTGNTIDLDNTSKQHNLKVHTVSCSRIPELKHQLI